MGKPTVGGDKPQGVVGAPNEAALIALMEKTGYTMIQENGQRKYGGPPPGWEGPSPPRGCEVFVGKIPRDCYEDELVPAFSRIGKIYEFRLMMDFSGSNRGYAFVMYTNKQDANKAVKEMNNCEIRKGRFLGVCPSVDNCRLFVGGIPKSKTRGEILVEMEKVTDGVKDVIVYPSAVDKSKNRGFAFVEYISHRTAAMARRKLIPGRIQLWGHQIAVDWAEPEQDVDDEIMNKVRILYVRNLMLSTTEDTILKAFSKACGKEDTIERVKKLKDYAFIHFHDRDDAIKAMNAMDGAILEGSKIEVVLAKPVDKAEYLRYSRTKNALPQIEEEDMDNLGEALGYGLAFNDSGTVYNQFYGPVQPVMGRGMMRGALRGRGRGAAGLRGAGGTRLSYLPASPGAARSSYRRFPPEVLEEVCQRNCWGGPSYQLHSTITRDGSGDMQLFLFKVTIPAMPSTLFQPNKLSKSIDEAKSIAAEYTLAQLGIPLDGSEQLVNPYQGRPIPLSIPVVTSAPGKMPQPVPPPPHMMEYQQYDYHHAAAAAGSGYPTVSQASYQTEFKTYAT
ncbi:hypothetical protein CHS0354_005084 [Potamilus streckersoni]|uniref:RNA-binding protein 46 n=1 Tax=Potamilus streckersoni TaxID=2493646 RepID=A0AAE0SHN2_9BIVA|nr:hypothetical protein CHS0354_005084 [Potamilus streckersoni]